MREIKIQKRSEFAEFVDAISKVNDSAIISAIEGEPGTLTSVVASEDNTLILYAENQIECVNYSGTCNVPDLKKLSRIVDSISRDDFKLIVNSNNLEYNGSDVKFKYHLYEDGFLTKPSINIDKIKGFNYDLSFKLTKANIQSIMKGCSFATQTNKVYFFTEDGSLKAELTDRSRHNTDVFCQNLAEVDFTLKPIPINIDNLKLIATINDTINVSINTDYGVVIFDICNNSTKLKYILSSLTQ
jgi:hypothetical protein